MIYTVLAQAIVREELTISYRVPSLLKRPIANRILELEHQILHAEKEIDKDKLRAKIKDAILRRFTTDFPIDCSSCNSLVDCIEQECVDISLNVCDDFFLTPTIQTSIDKHKRVATILAERHGIDTPSLFLEIDTLLGHFVKESQRKLVNSFRGL